MKSQARIDEFAFILLAGLVFIAVLVWFYMTPGKISVSPSSITLSLTPADNLFFYLNLSGESENVSLKAVGDISRIIYFSENYFPLANSKRVKVGILPQIGVYSGSIIVEGEVDRIEVPVTIEITEAPLLKRREIKPFGAFRLESKAEEKIFTKKKDFEVTPDKIVSLSADLSQYLPFIKDLYLYLKVEETNKESPLVVRVNGKEVFKKLAAGIVKIKLNKTDVVNIEFTASPTWKFWVKPYYKIEEARVEATISVSSKKVFNFSLSSEEVTNFKKIELAMFISNYSLPIPKLLVKLNDKIIYWERPPLKSIVLNVSRDILGMPLYVALSNSISFEITEKGFIDFASASLAVYYS